MLHTLAGATGNFTSSEKECYRLNICLLISSISYAFERFVPMPGPDNLIFSLSPSGKETGSVVPLDHALECGLFFSSQCNSLLITRLLFHPRLPLSCLQLITSYVIQELYLLYTIFSKVSSLIFCREMNERVIHGKFGMSISILSGHHAVRSNLI